MTTQDRRLVEGVELGEMRPDELEDAAALLAEAYRDNALTFAMLGNDPERRLDVNRGIHAYRLQAMAPPPIVARAGGRLVGVSGFEPPHGGKQTPAAQRAFYDYLVEHGIAQLAQELIAGFVAAAPPGDHWHLGPVGVIPDAQGLGVGTLLVEEFCRRVDAASASAALETDSEDNVRLYERFGFVTRAVADVIGVPMWFMLRDPKS